MFPRVVLLTVGLCLGVNTVWLLVTKAYTAGLIFEVVAAVAFVAYGILVKLLPKWVHVVCSVLLLGVIALTTAMAWDGSRDTVTNDEDALIVLGAAVWGKQVSPTLSARLDAAVAYSERNPGALIVASGGQGPGEDIPEAIAMRDYLTAHGVASNRILIEDRSTTTEENFAYSRQLLDERLGTEYRVAFVSNDFHIWRATRTAEKAGLSTPTHLRISSPWYIWPVTYLREIVTAFSLLQFPLALELLAASTCAILAGSLLDRLIGDPRRMPHLVRGIGALIVKVERLLRGKFEATSDKHTTAQLGKNSAILRSRGVWLVVIVLGVTGLITLAALVGAYAVSIWLGAAVEALICFQCLAVKSLRDEAAKIQTKLTAGDLAGARKAVAMIVGRDTDNLDEKEVARATVETVAENTSDGVVAPLLAMLIAGGFGGVIYKAINTMDSMVGYRNERYLHFGRAAALLDDAANWLPSRIGAFLMVCAAKLSGADWRNAWRIWRRDHANHASPNSAQTEAACAGALGIQLGGPATYAGQSHDKPTLGDPTRPLVPGDIARVNRLMSVTAWLTLVVVIAIRAIVLAML